VLLVERGRHPRFAIGESSTPLADLLLEELADEYDLPRVRVFSKWGTWQRERPDVAAGLKRGFSFFFHAGDGSTYADDETHARQLLVAASPHDAVADTHWYRADFDHALVREAERLGVEYVDETRVEQVREDGERIRLAGTRHGIPWGADADFLVDASGPRGALFHLLSIPERRRRWLPPTQALYTHFEDVGLWAEQQAAVDPPFPPDAAALHHVFPGGWIWVLRFNNGRTSAGAALTEPLAADLRAAEGASAWHRLLARLPSVASQFVAARPMLRFVHAPRVGFRVDRVCGERWALLPSAAGVIDPLLSTGFPLTLLGVVRLVDILTRTGGRARSEALAAYEAMTQQELDDTERLVGALYATMADPPLFKRLSLLYFAAAVLSEAARRLGRARLAPGFLLGAHPEFGPELRACADEAAAVPHGAVRDGLLARIDRAIGPFDLAGLGDFARRDWYPVRAEDLLAGAFRLQASPAEIRRLLVRSGFTPQNG
jgi:FADH2 O2-dependent halogenase